MLSADDAEVVLDIGERQVVVTLARGREPRPRRLPRPRPRSHHRLTPWRTVVWFGIVSLAADMVYEGARAITGPYLASLGASALVVGVVTGAARPPPSGCACCPGRWPTAAAGTGR